MSGRDQELQLGQALEKRARKGGALAHGDEDLVIREPCGRGLDAAQRLLHHIDLDGRSEASPIRHGERDSLIIIENGEPHHPVRIAMGSER